MEGKTLMEDGAMGKISPVGREELLTTLVQ